MSPPTYQADKNLGTAPYSWQFESFMSKDEMQQPFLKLYDSHTDYKAVVCVWPLRIWQLGMATQTMEMCYNFTQCSLQKGGVPFLVHHCPSSCRPLKIVRPFQSIFLLRSWYFSQTPYASEHMLPTITNLYNYQSEPIANQSRLEARLNDGSPCCEIPSSYLGFRASTTAKYKTPQIYIC